ncbi:protocatechuate 3,4-dioxygenase subunit alpha [Nocardia sp. NPDC051570]|uniref:protocatechuate 3,4-dioxygenase subunit alpha n=1 Tax=Nocardia sp. NPDC051570 TaxID=3364324 RepID=UPI0037B9DD58
MSARTRPPTPGQTVGPFFGYALPYEGGHRLISPWHPSAIRLHGTVFDGNGDPVPDALVEIRQADTTGAVPTVPGSLRRDGSTFTGWGRAAVDEAGHYEFATVTPGPVADSAPFIGMVIFARGLLDRLFTRIYLPATANPLADPLLASLPPERRRTLIADRDGDRSLRFDVRLQGAEETVFLDFTPRHRGSEARP